MLIRIVPIDPIEDYKYGVERYVTLRLQQQRYAKPAAAGHTACALFWPRPNQYPGPKQTGAAAAWASDLFTHDPRRMHNYAAEHASDTYLVYETVLQVIIYFINN